MVTLYVCYRCGEIQLKTIKENLMRLECGPMPNAMAALPNILWRYRLCVELHLTVQRDVERAGTDTQTCDTGV